MLKLNAKVVGMENNSFRNVFENEWQKLLIAVMIFYN